jgi:hypothetical protein
MKRTGWLVAAAVAAFGVYLIAARTSPPATAPAEKAPPGSVEIFPARPFGSSTLQVQVSGRGAAHREPASCRWLVNGNEVAGVTGATLGPEHFAKGDEVVAEARTEAGSAPLRTAAVRIQNTRPRLIAASADLRAEPSAEIYVEVSAVDADQDDISYRYQWYRNGDELPGESGATVDVSRFKMGDEVYALVTAHDGEEASSPRKSDPIRIGSNAPAITSNPPGTLEPGRRFVYQVTVRAPNPDAIRFELIEAPAGMTMDEDGLIEWTVPDGDEEAGGHAVAVRVSDDTGGEAVQRFRLSVAVQRGSAE